MVLLKKWFVLLQMCFFFFFSVIGNGPTTCDENLDWLIAHRERLWRHWRVTSLTDIDQNISDTELTDMFNEKYVQLMYWEKPL